MTSHELARALLALPDLEVFKHTSDGVFPIKALPVVETCDRWPSGSVFVAYYPEISPDEQDVRFQAVTL